MHDQILRLSDIGKLVEETIHNTVGNTYFWIIAEISSVHIRRGHCYLNLIEKDPGSAFPKAEMKGIIWNNIFAKVNQSFKEVTGFDIKQDISILFSARINYSIRYGLSLYVYDVKGEFTLGDMMIDRQKTIETLKKNGIFHLNKSIPIPIVPQRIAILSASDSKGFEDFMNVLKYNQYGYGFNVQLFSVMLQGNKAAESIAEQLKEIAKNKHIYDLVVIVRGGGGNVDLQCFNSYTLSEAVALCPLPVMTGIGHTTDISVTDEVACLHKDTPTGAAQHIVQMMFHFELSIIKQYEMLVRNSERILFEEWHMLEKSLKIIQHTPKLLLYQKKHETAKLIQYIFSASRSSITQQKTSLQHAKENMKNSSKNLIRSQDILIKHNIHSLRFSKHFTATEKGVYKKLLSEIAKNIKTTLMSEKQHLNQIRLRTEPFKPELMLKKGYAIVRYKGKVLHSIKQAESGTNIDIQLSDGIIHSQISTKQD